MQMFESVLWTPMNLRRTDAKGKKKKKGEENDNNKMNLCILTQGDCYACNECIIE